MDTIHFSPVKLAITGQEFRVVRSVQEAWTLLAEQWPMRPGKAHHRALTICTIALQGRAGAEIAREALIGAAAEAGIYLSAGSQPQKDTSNLLRSSLPVPHLIGIGPSCD
ncbi:DUF982 domain-containing protein [Phyllobacterium lublinensis]|uniref:DUF982 domain-containing protein n=1 Tax=Phyllobacterium lublinensis TaxID=2875708 RepID=UPI001CCBF5A1|nr:DUF982 domain-containing protein [Phyllobacterium sp. 2063]